MRKRVMTTKRRIEMEYRAEFAITLPEDLLDALGIDEDTLFEAYYDDGKIKVRILDEEALEDEFEDDDEDFDDLCEAVDDIYPLYEDEDDESDDPYRDYGFEERDLDDEE